MSGSVNILSHYAHRSLELGLVGSVKRAWARGVSPVTLWVQSLWWGWVAKRGMSESALISQTCGKRRTLKELLKHMSCRPNSTWLFLDGSKQETIRLISQQYPEYVEEVLNTADTICKNEISLLGQSFCFPEGIDWHRDPVSGWRWPVHHRSSMGQYIFSNTHDADPIFLWELNRHQYFITLGIAYWLTGNQQYVDVFCDHVQAWVKTNPLQHGINWYYPLETAIRLIAWTAAFQFFCDAPRFQEQAGAIFLKSLWQQMDFLSNHLQITRENIPNNHMLSELTAMIVVGTMFPEFRKASEWRDKGMKLFMQQIAAQTHADGVNKEQASGYHRFVGELLSLVVVLSRRGRLPQVPLLESNFENMLDYILYSLTPDGFAPLWGDSDYGRALIVGQKNDYWDFKPLLSIGAVLYDRPDLKFAAGAFDVQAFWLLGREGLHRWDQIESHAPRATSRAFSDAGHYIIRDSWTPNTDVAFFRCGPFGLGGEGHCAHAHNDLLSVMLWMNGKPLLVDSGTYAYHGQLRDHFRLVSAHNTVMVDDLEQAIPSPNFNWRRIPPSKCVDWKETSVTGSVTYANKVEFVRRLSHPKAGEWEVMDTFMGASGPHKFGWFFHFAAGLELRLDEPSGNLIVEEAGGSCFVVCPPKNITVKITRDWFSRSYGSRESNPVLLAEWTGSIPPGGMSFHWRFMQ